jgi:hypothetical protein
VAIIALMIATSQRSSPLFRFLAMALVYTEKGSLCFPNTNYEPIMFKPNLTKAQLREIIEEMSDLDVARFLYCQEMAGAYLAVGKFEDMLVSAMQMCDRVKLEKALGPDKDRWEQSLAKRAQLRGSTLGSLIKILERHGVREADIGYLKWIKDKRDYFVHRLFHDGAWPGDLVEEDCRFMTRRLIAIQLWLSRAERNIWSIFERAGFVELDRLEDGSLLATNAGIYELFEPETDEADEDHS